jgi:hypothetical protein
MKAARLLQVAAQPFPAWAPEDRDATWRRLAESASRVQARPSGFFSPRIRRLTLGFTLATAVATLAFVLVRPHSVSIGDEAELTATANAHYQLPPPVVGSTDPRQVDLQLGSVKVKAHSTQGIRVSTPQLRVEVQRALVQVQVAGEVTEVRVEEGRVGVARGDGPLVYLNGGEWIRSDDPRLARSQAQANTEGDSAPVPGAGPKKVVGPEDRCALLSQIEVRRSCLTQLALGSDLSAQNALYLLGLLERGEGKDGRAALEDWRAYQHRFPMGPLGPEVSIGAFSELLDEHRYDDALHEADNYLQHYPDDAHVDEVRLIRANLLREHLGQPKLALDGYEKLANSSKPSLRQEAEFGQALSLGALHRDAEERSALEHYLSEFPEGRHSREAHTLLGK